jgi:hypothetical protein
MMMASKTEIDSLYISYLLLHSKDTKKAGTGKLLSKYFQKFLIDYQRVTQNKKPIENQWVMYYNILYMLILYFKFGISV